MHDYGFIMLLLAVALGVMGIALNSSNQEQQYREKFMDSCLTDQKLYQCEVLWRKTAE